MDLRRSLLPLLLGLCALPITAATPPTDVRATAARAVLEDRYPARQVTFAGGVTGLPDLTYSQPAGYRPLTLDVYKPAGRGIHPLVLFVHGGGWVNGHTRHSGAFENWPGVLAQLASHGYVVASLNYRLSGEAGFPAQVHDVKTAIRWLRAHAADFGLDTTRAVVWGGSAGGHLAALAATSCDDATLAPPASAPTESDCVQGAVLWYPVVDVGMAAGSEPAGPNSPLAALLRCDPATCPAETLRQSSPLRQVSARTPPTLMVHGSDDRQVSVQQSVAFDAALRKAGVRSQLIVIPGVDHSFIGKDAATTRAASLQALDASFAFIDSLLGGRAP